MAQLMKYTQAQWDAMEAKKAARAKREYEPEKYFHLSEYERDKLRWPDGWITHLCNHNGTVRWATHSIHFHHAHKLCSPIHQKECLVKDGR